MPNDYHQQIIIISCNALTKTCLSTLETHLQNFTLTQKYYFNAHTHTINYKYYINIFLSISPNLLFHSFSSYHRLASYPPLQNKYPISCHIMSTIIIVSEGKVCWWSMVCVHTKSESDSALSFEFFFKMATSSHLDPPENSTPKPNTKWITEVD